MTMNICNPICS